MPILENAGLRVLSMSPFEAMGRPAGAAFIYVFAVQDAAQAHRSRRAGALLAEAILAVGRRRVQRHSMRWCSLPGSRGARWTCCAHTASMRSSSSSYPPASRCRSALRAHPTPRGCWSRCSPEVRPATVAAHDRAAAERARRRCAAFLTGPRERDVARRRPRAAPPARAARRDGAHQLLRARRRTPTTHVGRRAVHLVQDPERAAQSLVPSRLRAEVWVQSARMAGIHMRRGKVSRGGLRHSDRPDDLRTEVLGLVRTQSVKNCVIVPAGSKGGFVIRRHRSDPKQGRGSRGAVPHAHPRPARRDGQPGGRRAGATRCAGRARRGRIRTSSWRRTRAPRSSRTSRTPSPPSTASGWATRSRRAARTATTTRGRHHGARRLGVRAPPFPRDGRDIQTEPFTVVGIGDMSGDVFGNGMLLSPADPAGRGVRPPPHLRRPDPGSGNVVRRAAAPVRAGPLELGRLRPSLLSEGGFIVPRGIKDRAAAGGAQALGVPDDERCGWTARR
jgi:glutamate dehydrogenase